MLIFLHAVLLLQIRVKMSNKSMTVMIGIHLEFTHQVTPVFKS